MSTPGGRQMFSDTATTEGQKQTIRFDFIQFWSAKSLLWKARTSWSKRVWSFLTRLFSHFKSLFYGGTYRTFLLIFPAHFFLFLQHVFTRNIPDFFWCCRPEYILLYSDMVSKSIRYKCNKYENDTINNATKNPQQSPQLLSLELSPDFSSNFSCLTPRHCLMTSTVGS